MIVVDSSVWIDNLKGANTAAVQSLRTTRPRDLLVGDLVLLEVLRGARDEHHAAFLEAELRTFEIVPMLDDTLAAQAAQNYRRLRTLGFTMRGTVDLVIGTFCIAHGHRLLHDDRDYEPMEVHLGLKRHR